MVIFKYQAGTHQAGSLTRWPGCRTSCWAAALTLHSMPLQWMCSWCWGEDWPQSPFSPSGPPAGGQSRRSPRTARTASRRTSGTPRCRSDLPCLLCQMVRPIPRSVWTASGCRPSLEAGRGALERQELKKIPIRFLATASKNWLL